jgi:lysophospholipid acyltransferase (LPLAT)-like uncharacterized protein
MIRRIGRLRFVQHAIGALLAGYLGLVRRTSRATLIPEGFYAPVDDNSPVILTFWHGQHLMQTFPLRPHDRIHVMISRHGDGEINAHAAELLGMKIVRGSGAQRQDQVRKRGGVQALRALLSLLAAGEHVSMTADVPKNARVAGEGIITLAQLSGRPILPLGVVCSNRIDFKSWDAATVGVPFTRTAYVVGEPIFVPRDADAASREAIRRHLEAALDRMYADGYALLGAHDPGANRDSVRFAREAQAARAEAAIATGA